MKSLSSTLTTWLTAVCFFFGQTALAATSENLMGLDDTRASSTTSEYVFRSTTRGNLVPIQVLGAVAKPGLYFVPQRTDLVRLLTLAGGPQSAADDEVLVRKADRSWMDLSISGLKRDNGSAFEVDIPKVLKQGDYANLTLSPNDVVYVPQREPWISQDMFRTVSVVSLVMSIVLTAVLIDQKSK